MERRDSRSETSAVYHRTSDEVNAEGLADFGSYETYVRRDRDDASRKVLDRVPAILFGRLYVEHRETRRDDRRNEIVVLEGRDFHEKIDWAIVFVVAYEGHGDDIATGEGA